MGDRTPRLTRIGLVGAFALLLTAAFPFRAGELRFDLGAFAGWIALIPFALLVRGLSVRAGFVWATAAGTVAYCGILFWIFVVVHVHGHAPVWAALAAVVLLALYVGVHIGLAGALTAALEPHAGRAAFAVLPAAWVLAEVLRTVQPGFPWAFLGYSVWEDGPVRSLGGLGGVFGLSFLLASVASLASRRAWSAALLLVVAAHALGLVLRFAEARAAGQPAPGPRVALVQASIPQEQKWDRELARQAFQKHLDTSRLAALSGPLDLILWPETSVPVFLELEEEYRDQVLELSRESGAPIVLGGMAVEPERTPGRYRYFNSVYVVDPADGLVDRYDKTRLVPFGEYVPFRFLFGVLSGVATGLASGDVTPGPGPRSLVLATLGAEHAVAPLICYEVIYPGLVREAVRGGARVLLNLTNDAWYGRTSAPHQFLAIAAMRSAEHGLPMLRAANTGISAIIDADGAVQSETPLFEQHAITGRIPALRPGGTLYTRLGDWPVFASAVLLIALGGTRIVRSQRRSAGAAGSPREARRTRRRASEAPLTSTPAEPDSKS